MALELLLSFRRHREPLLHLVQLLVLGRDVGLKGMNLFRQRTDFLFGSLLTVGHRCFFLFQLGNLGLVILDLVPLLVRLGLEGLNLAIEVLEPAG